MKKNFKNLLKNLLGRNSRKVKKAKVYNRKNNLRKKSINHGKHSKKLRWDRIIVLLCIIGLIISFISLHNENNNKKNTITYYNNQTEELNNELDNTKTKLEETTNQLNDTNTKLTETTNQLNDANTKITELEGTIENLNSEITELKKKTSTTSRGGTISRNTATPSTENDGTYIAFEATGYCPCAKCCDVQTGITASGTRATAGRTVAMSKNYAFGTNIEIKGMGTYVVEDRGGAIQGNRIDIYFDSHQEALNFGRRTVYLKVLN